MNDSTPTPFVSSEVETHARGVSTTLDASGLGLRKDFPGLITAAGKP